MSVKAVSHLIKLVGKHGRSLWKSLKEGRGQFDLPKVDLQPAKPALKQTCEVLNSSRFPFLSSFKLHHGKTAVSQAQGRWYNKNTQCLRNQGCIYSFLGVSLVAQAAMKFQQQTNEDGAIFVAISEMIKQDMNNQHITQKDNLGGHIEDYEIGSIISKGCNGVVYEARLHQDVKTQSDVEEDDFVVIPESVDNEEQREVTMGDAVVDVGLCLMKDHVVTEAGEDNDQQLILISNSFNIGENNDPSGDGEVKFDRALKIIFNPISSNEDEIYSKFYREMIPARHSQHTEYSMTLEDYLKTRNPDVETSLVLVAQIVEGIIHLKDHRIAHRDLKSNNILLDCSNGDDYPCLVLSDFGCCHKSLTLDFRDGISKGGNRALMAPEIKTAKPGQMLQYGKSDLWAAGAIAYEILTKENPFTRKKDTLDSTNFNMESLPKISGEGQAFLNNLLHAMLDIEPSRRPAPWVVAMVIELYLWAPKSWHYKKWLINKHELVTWLISMYAQVKWWTLTGLGDMIEVQLKQTFLSRLNLQALMYGLELTRNLCG